MHSSTRQMIAPLGGVVIKRAKLAMDANKQEVIASWFVGVHGSENKKKMALSLYSPQALQSALQSISDLMALDIKQQFARYVENMKQEPNANTERKDQIASQCAVSVKIRIDGVLGGGETKMLSSLRELYQFADDKKIPLVKEAETLRIFQVTEQEGAFKQIMKFKETMLPPVQVAPLSERTQHLHV